MKTVYRKITACTLALALAVCALFASSFAASADLVVIEASQTQELLTLENIGAEGGNSSGGTVWPTKGSLTQTDGAYTLTSNGLAQWYNFDGISFAYKKIYFQYGNQAKLTLEGTLNAFNGKNDNAGAGIMIRSGLNPDAATVMMHIRPVWLCSTYRAKIGGESVLGSRQEMTAANIAAGYPYRFKIELQKTTVSCYYQMKGQSSWSPFGSVPMARDGDYIYIGFCQYSQDEAYTATAKFSDFFYQVWAPEGTKPGPGEEGETSNASSEAEVQLPTDPDLPAAEVSDILLRETFTDGSMTEGKAAIANPVWDIEGDAYEIVTDEAGTNRFLSLEYADAATAFFAGDRKWADYTFKTELTFTTKSAKTEKNALHFYVRHTDYDQYGYEDYTVSLTDGNTISLSQRTGTNVYYGQGPVLLQSAALPYIQFNDVTGNLDAQQRHTIEIRVFDNTITVFWDGAEVLTYVDPGNDQGNAHQDSGYEVKTTGCVGFSAEGACVDFDNLFVYKLEDPLGGEYDNRIGGSWDKARPDDWLSLYSDLPY